MCVLLHDRTVSRAHRNSRVNNRDANTARESIVVQHADRGATLHVVVSERQPVYHVAATVHRVESTPAELRCERQPRLERRYSISDADAVNHHNRPRRQDGFNAHARPETMRTASIRPFDRRSSSNSKPVFSLYCWLKGVCVCVSERFCRKRWEGRVCIVLRSEPDESVSRLLILCMS